MINTQQEKINYYKQKIEKYKGKINEFEQNAAGLSFGIGTKMIIFNSKDLTNFSQLNYNFLESKIGGKAYIIDVDSNVAKVFVDKSKKDSAVFKYEITFDNKFNEYNHSETYELVNNSTKNIYALDNYIIISFGAISNESLFKFK